MVVLHEIQSASFLPESLFESSSVWTTSHSLHSCLTLHLASRVSPQSMPTTKDRNFCTGQSRYPSGNGGAQSWVQQVGIQKGLLLGSDGSLVLQVKVTFLGGKKLGEQKKGKGKLGRAVVEVPGECFPLEFSAVQQVVMVRTRFWPYFFPTSM